MKHITPETMTPAVRICNWNDVAPEMFWGPRAINDFELILIVSGTYDYTWGDDEQIVLEPGEVLCIRPLEQHVLRRVDMEPGSVISCIHLEMDEHTSWLDKGYEVDPFPSRVTRPGAPETITWLFRRCADLFEDFGPYREARLQTAVKSLILELAPEWQADVTPELSTRMMQMLTYLRANLLDGVTRRDVAAEFGITPEHVNALFKRELAMTPTEFVNRERILMGYRMLRDEGKSVKEAAAVTGFCDQFYFSKLFHRYMGVPPVRVTWRSL